MAVVSLGALATAGTVGSGNVGEAVVFWVCAILAVAGALGLVLSRKAVHCALWTALTMLNLAVLYFALGAPFLGVAQAVVYTGAVMMLFLFVVMVVGVESSDSMVETLRGQRRWAIVIGVTISGLLMSAVSRATLSDPVGFPTGAPGYSNLVSLARLIFTRYVFAFEVVSAVVITAALGAMVLAHRERMVPKLTQREMQRRRFQVAGRHPGALPNPGIYARHNAVDTPALLPDGSLSPESVPAPLQVRGDVLAVPASARGPLPTGVLGDEREPGPDSGAHLRSAPELTAPELSGDDDLEQTVRRS